MTRYVVCAAVKLGEVTVCGPRHGDCINSAIAFGVYKDDNPGDCVLGFVDQDNNFMTRVEAWAVADMAGQIRRPTGYEQDHSRIRPAGIGDSCQLFSENLY